MSRQHATQELEAVFEDESHWLAGLVFLGLGLQVVQILRLIHRFERPPMSPDAGIFQHIGWVLTRGGQLYVDAWEPKLPLPFETTALLAMLSGGDMYLYHVLNVALMSVAAVGSMALIGLLTYRITSDRVPSLFAGFSPLLLPGFLVRPAYGFKAKYLLLFFGLLAVYLLLEGHPLASGVSAAASFGYYQLGVIFPLVVVGLAWQRRGPRTAGKVVAGGAALTLLSFAPVVLAWNSVSQLVAQALVIPAVVGGEAPLAKKLLAGGVHFKWASPFVLVGGYGFLRSVRGELGRKHWWVTACTVWFGLALFLLDFDVGGYTDLLPGLAFLAIGIGLFADRHSNPEVHRALGGLMAAVIIVNTVALGSFGLVFERVDTREPASMETLATNERAQAIETVPDDTPDVRYLYWNKETAETCHYRLSLTEVHWLQRAGSDISTDCSDMAEVRRVL
jgi:hypothetical protein